MRLITLSLIVMSMSPAFAAKKELANFTPGQYVLSEGPADICVPGNFKITPDGKYVQFGSKHGFAIRTTSSVSDGSVPEDADCKYESRDKVEATDKSTLLINNETLRCPDGIRHVLSRIARVTADKVDLAIKQEGNPSFGDAEQSFEYRCVFTKKK